jgi:NAD(P)-dependent dehydrogenase (short-subunit alcohol dehydrogenase family)
MTQQALTDAAHHAAASHGVAGLMRALALAPAPHSIRVNSNRPTGARPIRGVDPVDIGSAQLFLALDEARNNTGVMYLAEPARARPPDSQAVAVGREIPPGKQEER